MNAAASSEVTRALRTAARGYRHLGPSAAGFALGKLICDPLYRQVASLMPRRGRLLDVGCGEGYLLVLARRIQPELALIGLDHDARRLATARAALRCDQRIKLIEATLPCADLPEAELVACLDVLHYMPPSHQDETLEALTRAVAPGGVLVVRDNTSVAGWRTRMGRWTEHVTMALGRQKGAGVFLRPATEIAAAIESCGMVLDQNVSSKPTALGSVLLVARRRERDGP